LKKDRTSNTEVWGIVALRPMWLSASETPRYPNGLSAGFAIQTCGWMRGGGSGHRNSESAGRFHSAASQKEADSFLLPQGRGRGKTNPAAGRRAGRKRGAGCLFQKVDTVGEPKQAFICFKLKFNWFPLIATYRSIRVGR